MRKEVGGGEGEKERRTHILARQSRSVEAWMGSDWTTRATEKTPSSWTVNVREIRITTCPCFTANADVLGSLRTVNAGRKP